MPLRFPLPALATRGIAAAATAAMAAHVAAQTPPPAAAPDPNGWTLVAETPRVRWHLKNDSVRDIEVGGLDMAKKAIHHEFTYRRTVVGSDQIEVGRLSLPAEACARGWGMAQLTGPGLQPLGKPAFVRGGRAGMDMVASAACSLREAAAGQAMPAAASQPPAWQQLATGTDGLVWRVRADTLRKNLLAGASVMMSRHDPARDDWQYFDFFVYRSDCSQGHGRAGYIGFDGRDLGNVDFALGSGAVSAVLAQYVCDRARNS